jgi:hypothetical protein
VIAAIGAGCSGCFGRVTTSADSARLEQERWLRAEAERRAAVRVEVERLNALTRELPLAAALELRRSRRR